MTGTMMQVLIIGCSETGLAAAQAAKDMGARVFMFDKDVAFNNQVSELGAEFLRVPSGQGSEYWQHFTAAEVSFTPNCTH